MRPQSCLPDAGGDVVVELCLFGLSGSLAQMSRSVTMDDRRSLGLTTSVSAPLANTATTRPRMLRGQTYRKPGRLVRHSAETRIYGDLLTHTSIEMAYSVG